ncbi:hypothetical protein GCM10027265_00780 [Jatrophihabitans fulvus]
MHGADAPVPHAARTPRLLRRALLLAALAGGFWILLLAMHSESASARTPDSPAPERPAATAHQHATERPADAVRDVVRGLDRVVRRVDDTVRGAVRSTAPELDRTVVEPTVKRVVRPAVTTVTRTVERTVTRVVEQPVVREVTRTVVRTVDSALTATKLRPVLEPVLRPVVEPIVRVVAPTPVAPVVQPVVDALVTPAHRDTVATDDVRDRAVSAGAALAGDTSTAPSAGPSGTVADAAPTTASTDASVDAATVSATTAQQSTVAAADPAVPGTPVPGPFDLPSGADAPPAPAGGSTSSLAWADIAGVRVTPPGVGAIPAREESVLTGCCALRPTFSPD